MASFSPPTNVSRDLILEVETSRLDETVGQAECHGGVIGPLAWFESEGAAPHHIGDGCERPPGFELHSGADGIAGGQPKEAALKAVQEGYGGQKFLCNEKAVE